VNCRKVCSLLSAYMDGELTGTESLRIREHLSGCPACDAEYQSLLDTKLMICSLGVAEPQPEFEQRLMASLRDLSPERGRFHRIIGLFALDGPRTRLRAAGLFTAASLVVLAFSIRFTVESQARNAPVTMVNSRLDPNEPLSRREQDLWFAHETFERPQPARYRDVASDPQMNERPVVRPLPGWDAAIPAASP